MSRERPASEPQRAAPDGSQSRLGTAAAPQSDQADYSLEVDVRADGWDACSPETLIARAAAATASHVPGLRGEIGFILADDAFAQRLNRDHRGQDKPTNVLSFPIGPAGLDDTGPFLLGDIVLARETVEREATEQGKTVQAHTTHLVVHGLLHLLGHDHQADAEASAMEELERQILAALNIADPYAADLDAASGKTKP